MKRLLAIAGFVYGDQIRREVFEPLVADLQNEIATRRSIATRLRWSGALGSTFLLCLPRATFARLPASLCLDLVLRALSFSAIVATVQLLFARYMPGAVLITNSIAALTPFVVLPIVWRIRVSDLLIHQQRLLGVAAIGTSGIMNTLSGESWLVSLAVVASSGIAALFGWRLGDPAFYNHANVVRNPWAKPFMIAAAFQASSWPVTLALGLPWDALGPRVTPISYVIGAVVYFSIRHERRWTNK